jgi:putative membrane protein
MGRSLKDYLFVYFKGILMGGADVIPGVSGGTIAFITGIYDELIDSLKNIDLIALQLLFKFKISEAWSRVNGSFLLAILAGILTSLLSLAKLMSYLLDQFPIQTWSFFIGLIIVSSMQIFKNIQKWNFSVVISSVLGIIISYTITILSPAQTPTALPFIFLCGSLAICAMILPGISGAFILLLIGKYEFMITSLTNFNVTIIIVFALGCVFGLIFFSKLLGWVLHHFRYPTIGLLAGFMLGSLNKVWPWKEVTAYRMDHLGNQIPAFDKSVLPFRYYEVTGNNPHVFHAILFAALGILLVIGIEKTAAYLKSN